MQLIMKRFLLVLVSIILFCNMVSAQVHYTKKEKMNHIDYFSKQYKVHKTFNNKIKASIIDYKGSRYSSDTILREIEDSIQMEFEVATIEKMDGFYKIKKGKEYKDNKLKKVDVYHIMLCPIVDEKILIDTVYIWDKMFIGPVTYHVFSVGDTVLKSEVIKAGQRYNFLLLSFFDKKFPPIYNGYVTTLCFDDVCTLTFPIGRYSNFYITPNLMGLYYIEDKDGL